MSYKDILKVTPVIMSARLVKESITTKNPIKNAAKIITGTALIKSTAQFIDF